MSIFSRFVFRSAQRALWKVFLFRGESTGNLWDASDALMTQSKASSLSPVFMVPRLSAARCCGYVFVSVRDSDGGKAEATNFLYRTGS